MIEPFDPNNPNDVLEAEFAKKKPNGKTTTDNRWVIPPPPEGWPKPLGAAAYLGVTGDFVRLVTPATESDPAALLTQFLASAGNCFGDRAWFAVEQTRHYGNIFVLLAGDTSKARKGTSAGQVRSVFEEADPKWETECTTSGLSSGEGLIERVRDTVYKTDPKTGAVEIDKPGVADKRLLINEEEFSRPLRVMNRPDNILASVLQQAWDGKRLGIMTRGNPVKATGATISIVGHITIEQLRAELTEINTVNGFANRFLFVAVRRSNMLPFGGSVDEAALSNIATRLRDAFKAAPRKSLRFDEIARRRWIEVYPDLSAAQPGLYGAAIARSEAQTVRLALIYALLDQQDEIGIAHLEAALEVVRYANNSARFIFSDNTGNRIADTLLRALRSTDRLTRFEINNDLFGRNVKSDEITNALDLLVASDKIQRVSLPSTRGRPPEAWRAV